MNLLMLLLELLSHHQVWTVIIGVVTGCLVLWTFYKDFFQGPDISLYSGDSVDLIRSADLVTRKMHVACTFANGSRKAGIVSKVALVVIAPNSKATIFHWQLFYKYQGVNISVGDSRVIPIAVPGNESVFQGIEFETKDSVTWDVGTWTIKVLAWVGQDRIDKKPTVQDEFSIILTPAFIADLISKKQIAQAELRTVMIQSREINPEILT